MANIQVKVATNPNFRPTIPSNEFIDKKFDSIEYSENDKSNFYKCIEKMKQGWSHEPKNR